MDDFLGASNDVFKKEMIDEICRKFDISKGEENRFRYTGFDVEIVEDGIRRCIMRK